MNEELVRKLAAEGIVPVCPEHLGGFGTPRSRAEIVGGDGHDVLAGRAKVVNAEGQDVTEGFLCGAKETLDLAKRLAAREAYLKSNSPSCGRDGLAHGNGVRPGDGVTAALLLENGIEVIRVG